MKNVSNLESLDTNTLKLILRKALVEKQENMDWMGVGRVHENRTKEHVWRDAVCAAPP